MKQCRIIAIANHKGGVGKTTTTKELGSILARKGHKVLLIDLDAQANLTASQSTVTDGPGIYEVMTGRVDRLPVISISECLDLVPSSLSLAMVDIELASSIARERILADAIENSRARAEYDFILLDCPPSLSLMTLNAFTACTDIIIPLICEVLPFTGLAKINDFIKKVQRLNPAAHVTGIIVTRWEKSKLSCGIEDNLRKVLGERVFSTKIRKNVRLAETPLERKNIVDYDSTSNGAKDYQAFADEILERLG